MPGEEDHREIGGLHLRESSERRLDALRGRTHPLAGHGFEPTPSEDMVFVTSTVASLAPADLRAAGLAWNELGSRLARARGRVVVLLDACHSGHISQQLVVPNDRLALALAREASSRRPCSPRCATRAPTTTATA